MGSGRSDEERMEFKAQVQDCWVSFEDFVRLQVEVFRKNLVYVSGSPRGETRGTAAAKKYKKVRGEELGSLTFVRLGRSGLGAGAGGAGDERLLSWFRSRPGNVDLKIPEESLLSFRTLVESPWKVAFCVVLPSIFLLLSVFIALVGKNGDRVRFLVRVRANEENSLRQLYEQFVRVRTVGLTQSLRELEENEKKEEEEKRFFEETKGKSLKLHEEDAESDSSGSEERFQTPARD